ncbi:MAG: ERAP1-like C-terminal domain-containing protein [Myxococcota bacterium]
MERFESSLEYDDDCPQYAILNADGAGYYRFLLNTEAMAGVIDAAGSGVLSARERLALVDSLGAGFLSGAVPADDYFSALKRLVPSSGPLELKAILDTLTRVRGALVSSEKRPAVERFARELLLTRFKALGYTPKASDSVDDARLRVALLDFMVFVARDRVVRAEAARRGGVLFRNGQLEAGGALVAVLLGAAVQVDDFVEPLVERLATSTDAVERRTILSALGRVEKSERARQVRDLVLDPRLQSSERGVLLLSLSQEPELATESWLWLRENFDAFVREAGEAAAANTPTVAVPLCDIRTPDAMDEFFGERIERIRGGPERLMLALERVELCVEQVRALRPALDRFFAVDEIARR